MGAACLALNVLKELNDIWVLGPEIKVRLLCASIIRSHSLCPNSYEELRCRLALHGLVGGIPRFRKRPGITFSGILKLAYVSATLTHAFANRALWHGNYPMVGTMRVDVLGELVLISSRWDDATVYPVLGRLEGYVEF